MITAILLISGGLLLLAILAPGRYWMVIARLHLHRMFRDLRKAMHIHKDRFKNRAPDGSAIPEKKTASEEIIRRAKRKLTTLQEKAGGNTLKAWTIAIMADMLIAGAIFFFNGMKTRMKEQWAKRHPSSPALPAAGSGTLPTAGSSTATPTPRGLRRLIDKDNKAGLTIALLTIAILGEVVREHPELLKTALWIGGAIGALVLWWRRPTRQSDGGNVGRAHGKVWGWLRNIDFKTTLKCATIVIIATMVYSFCQSWLQVHRESLPVEMERLKASHPPYIKHFVAPGKKGEFSEPISSLGRKWDLMPEWPRGIPLTFRVTLEGHNRPEPDFDADGVAKIPRMERVIALQFSAQHARQDVEGDVIQTFNPFRPD